MHLVNYYMKVVLVPMILGFICGLKPPKGITFLYFTFDYHEAIV